MKNGHKISPLFELGLKFGFTCLSLSGDGNTFVGGTPLTTTNVIQSGMAIVYKFSGGNWTQMVQDINTTNAFSWT